MRRVVCSYHHILVRFRCRAATFLTFLSMDHLEPVRRPASCAYSENCTGAEWTSYELSTWRSQSVQILLTAQVIWFVPSWKQTPSNKKVEISTIASNYHIEINPRYGLRITCCTHSLPVSTRPARSDAGIYDRVVIQEVLKEVAQSHTLDTHKEFKGLVKLMHSCM